jgi:hypothetical protein
MSMPMKYEAKNMTIPRVIEITSQIPIFEKAKIQPVTVRKELSQFTNEHAAVIPMKNREEIVNMAIKFFIIYYRIAIN